MNINTALILCAGFGKRLNPLTLKKPKPLLSIRNKSLLLRTIELALSLGIKKIKINTFYLPEQIYEFIRLLPYQNKIEVINDGEVILDTGGGIKNMLKNTTEENFLIFNPDTLWESNYKKNIISMINYFEKNKLDNLLMVTNKKYSFDDRFTGDFQLKNFKLTKESKNTYIYIGLQIINKKLFKDIHDIKFSMNKVWTSQIDKSNLFGFESLEKFIHLTDIEIYNKLLKY